MPKSNQKQPKQKRNEAVSIDKKVDQAKQKTSQNKSTRDRVRENRDEPARPDTKGVGSGVKNMSLTTIKRTRKTCARLIKAFNNDKIDAEKFRLIMYGITILLQALKSEINQDLEERVEKLEARFNDVN